MRDHRAPHATLPPRLTFAQARLLLHLASGGAAALVIETVDGNNPYEPPHFHGFAYRQGCPTCGHAKRDAVSWRVINALAEAACIAGSEDWYNRVTEVGREAIETARERWPNMSAWRPRDA